MDRPLVQENGETRPMTDEELKAYEALIADTPALPSAE
jgi:hypothetical protein